MQPGELNWVELTPHESLSQNAQTLYEMRTTGAHTPMKRPMVDDMIKREELAEQDAPQAVTQIIEKAQSEQEVFSCVAEREVQVDRLSLTKNAMLAKLKLFLALSRTPHGLLDLATPGLAALLCLGDFPSLGVAILGLITVFAGYTAVYALNDVVDYRTDRTKIGEGGLMREGYLDAVMVRHPMAQGFLSFKEGLAWAVAWAAVALLGAYLLNPVCALIFILGCVLEAIYCFLLEISHWRVLVSGVVKTLGGVAAVFAVDPSPSPLFLTLLILFVFCWEVGGQNVPADWTDIEEDRRWHAKTVPVHYGAAGSCRIILISLVLAVILLFPLMAMSPLRFSWGLWAVAGGAGIYLLLMPAVRLYRSRERSQAMALFNKASYFPLAVLVITLVALLG
jgi:4-hydroxybenzoate polyprenyltransferase